MVVKTFFTGERIEDSKRATVMLEGPENILYSIFTSQETKPIVEALVIFMKKQKSQDG